MYGFGRHHKLTGLAKLNEEAGEVIQVIGKFMMIEGDTRHWSGDLTAMIVDEMADLQAAIDFVRRHNFSPTQNGQFHARTLEKGQKFEHWFNEGVRHEGTRLDA